MDRERNQRKVTNQKLSTHLKGFQSLVHFLSKKVLICAMEGIKFQARNGSRSQSRGSMISPPRTATNLSGILKTPSKSSLSQEKNQSGRKFYGKKSPPRELDISETIEDLPVENFSQENYQLSHRENLHRGEDYLYKSIDMREIKTDRSSNRKQSRSRKSQSGKSDGSDYSDEESDTEDKIVKIQVKFKNEEMEKQIESLG